MATEAQVSSNANTTRHDENGIDCLLCFKTLKIPRLLPCFHSFCEKCLSTNIQSHTVSDYFKCPVCQVETQPLRPTNNKSNVEEWASKFPMDEMAISVMEAMNGNEEDNFCVACRRVDETCEAEFWCVDCKDKICSSCKHNHKRVKILAQHEIVSLDDKESLRLKFEHHCNCSYGKKVEYFCNNHNAILCVECSGAVHKQCKDISRLDISDEHDSKNMDMNISKEIQKLQTSVENLIMGRKKTEEMTKISKDYWTVHEVEKNYDELVKVVNASRRKVMNEIEQKYNNVIQNNQKFEDSIKCFSTNVQNSENIANVVQSYGSAHQILVADIILIAGLQSHFVQLKTFLANEKKVEFGNFDSKSHIPDIEKILFSLQKQGKVSIAKTETSQGLVKTIDIIMKTLETRALRRFPTICAAHFPKSKEYTCFKRVTQEDIGNVLFTGGTFLKDGRLLMADNRGKRLVKFDCDYSYQRHYALTGKPRDVAKGINDKEIYVCIERNQTQDDIYKCRLDNKLKLITKIEDPVDYDETWGITVLPGGVLVCGTKTGTVIEWSPHTNMRICTIHVHGGPKTSLYGNPIKYIAASLKNPEFYYLDKNIVRSKTADDYFFEYPAKLLDPVGIALDNDDNIYVCELTGNIHQLSSEGNLIQVIPCMKSPSLIVVHPQNKDIVVVYMHEEGNHDPENKDLVFEVYRKT